MKGNDTDRHVVPNPDGGWDAEKEDAEHASGHFDKQQEGIDHARRIVGNAGGGETVVHDRDGEIRDKDTTPPR
jgi:hypothetical protein